MFAKIIKFLSPMGSYILPISYIIVMAACFYSSHVWHGYKEKKVLQKQTEVYLEAQKFDRQLIRELNANFKNLDKEYIKLKEKKNAIKLVDRNCNLTPDALQLWNESTFGKQVVPTTPRGTVGVGGASISEAYDNKLENDERYNRNRERNKKLKEWKKEHFGD